MAFQFTQTGQELQYLADEAEKIAAEYDAAASWVTGDYCTHEGTIYRCTASTTGTFDATKWTAVILCDELEGLRTRMSTAEGNISTAQGDITTLKNRATVTNLTVTAGTNVTLGTSKACIIDGFIYLAVKGKANAAISNAVVATISGDKYFISPTTIPIGIGGEWTITSTGYGFINAQSLTATVPSGSWFHLVATIPYA